jgi:hypothetical protein
MSKTIDLSITHEIIDLTVLDGGRDSFQLKNKNGTFWIRFVRNGFNQKPYDDGYWLGGVYLNNELLNVHSTEEQNLVKCLSLAKITKNIYDSQEQLILTQSLIKDCIQFIDSKEYIEFAKESGRL